MKITTTKLTRERLTSLLETVCARAGFPFPHDAELIKFTNNAVFRLRHVPVVVRIAGSTAARDRVPAMVTAARWLARHDFPAVRLLGDVEQPLNVDDHLITLWNYVPETGLRPSGKDLGKLLRRLHALDDPPDLPPWQPMKEIRQRLDEPEELSTEDHAFLQKECDEVEAQLERLNYVLEPGVIHGDAFLGNLISGPHGIVLCDFDSTTVGPREWDLVPVAAGSMRMDYPVDDHPPLAAEYGFDVSAWEGFPVLRRLREIKLVTSVLPVLRSNPAIRPQWEHRMRSFKARDLTLKWHPYQ